MNFVIVGSFLFAAYTITQAIHILAHGDMRPFYLARTRTKKPQAKWSRVLAAGVYITPGLFIVVLLVAELTKNGGRLLKLVVLGNPMGLLVGTIFECYGLVAILRPDIVLRQAMSAHPGEFFEHKTFAATIARVVGVGLCVLGFFILTLP
jgi:hypothetical protein